MTERPKRRRKRHRRKRKGEGKRAVIDAQPLPVPVSTFADVPSLQSLRSRLAQLARGSNG